MPVTVTFDNPSTAPAPLAEWLSNVAAIDLGSATMLILSGQVAFDHEGSIVGNDITAQTVQVFDGIGALLAAHGAGYEHVVNIKTYLADIDHLGEYGAARGKYFTGMPPTSTAVEVSRLFHEDALLEVDIIAVVPKTT